MKRAALAFSFALVLITTLNLVSAQTDTTKHYTSKNIVWRVHDKVAYEGGTKGYDSFTNIAADTDGKLYITDMGEKFTVLIIDSKTGKTLGKISDPTGTINKFYDVAPAGDGNLWVADNLSMVYLVDPKGKILLNVPFHNSPGLDDKNPVKVGVGPDGNLYVLYSSGGPVLNMQVFTPKGEFVRSILLGTSVGTTSLGEAQTFAFMPDGTLVIGADSGLAEVVEDNGKDTLKLFAADAVKEFNVGENTGLAVDADGNVYFSGMLGVVAKVDKDGKPLGEYGKGQKQIDWENDFGPDELAFTVTLAVAPDGDLMISDTNNWYTQLMKIDMQK